MHNILRIDRVGHNVHHNNTKKLITEHGCVFGVHDRVFGDRKNVFGLWNFDKFCLPVYGVKDERDRKTINIVDIQFIR